MLGLCQRTLPRSAGPNAPTLDSAAQRLFRLKYPAFRAEEKSWFEETSDQYQDGFDPDSDPEDDEDDAAPTETDDDTGGWEWPEDDEDSEPAPAPEDDDSDESEDDVPPGPDADPDPESDDTPHDDGPSGHHDDPGTGAPSGGPTSASVPTPGSVVITELMIHPQATEDAQGEWAEIQLDQHPVDLSGSLLADRGVDAVEIEPVSAGSSSSSPAATSPSVPTTTGTTAASAVMDISLLTLGRLCALNSEDEEAHLGLQLLMRFDTEASRSKAKHWRSIRTSSASQPMTTWGTGASSTACHLVTAGRPAAQRQLLQPGRVLTGWLNFVCSPSSCGPDRLRGDGHQPRMALTPSRSRGVGSGRECKTAWFWMEISVCRVSVCASAWWPADPRAALVAAIYGPTSIRA